MNVNKNLLLIVAIVGIGLFVLPSTLSMFAGQHTWYDPDNNGIPCQKCHFQEANELDVGGNTPHSPGYDGLYNTSDNTQYNASGDIGGDAYWGGSTTADRCAGCHQVVGNASTTNFANDTKHAAVVIDCLDCHPWVETELTHVDAAHKPFFENLSDSSTLAKPEARNQACIGCHTHVGVNITWEINKWISYNVTTGTSNYEVTINTTDTMGAYEDFNSSSAY